MGCARCVVTMPEARVADREVEIAKLRASLARVTAERDAQAAWNDRAAALVEALEAVEDAFVDYAKAPLCGADLEPVRKARRAAQKAREALFTKPKTDTAAERDAIAIALGCATGEGCLAAITALRNERDNAVMQRLTERALAKMPVNVADIYEAELVALRAVAEAARPLAGKHRKALTAALAGLAALRGSR